MAPIPEHLIDRIRESVNIVDVVGRYVTLKKRGRNFVGLCPFHQEKTPSFSVNTDKQIFHCFGCGAGGNVYSFLMQHDKRSFVEVVKELAGEAGIEIPVAPERREEENERDRLFRVNARAAEFYQQQLPDAPASLREYLQHRGLTDDAVRHFRIGYAPDDWGRLRDMVESTRGRVGDYRTLGLLLESEKSGRLYDRFRNRLMFPIEDANNRVVGFGGRALAEEDKSPKYINSPESPLYQKSRVLYGLNHSREAIREAGKVLVVEGYMDVIQLHQAGLKHAVATSGTALTGEHALILRSYASRVTLCYDADKAGINAAVRGGEMLFQQNLDTAVLILPPGEDPDSYVRQHGAPAFLERVEAALDFWDFRLQQLYSRYNMQQAGDRSAAISEVLDVLAAMSDAVRAAFFVERTAERLDIDRDILFGELKKKQRAASRRRDFSVEREEKQSKPARDDHRALAFTGAWGGEKDIILLLISYFSDISSYVFQHLAEDDFLNPEFRDLFTLIARIGEATPDKLLHHVLENCGSDSLRELLIRETEHNNAEFSKPALYLQGCIKHLKIARYAADIETTRQKLRSMQPEDPQYMETMMLLKTATIEVKKWKDVETG